MLNMIKDGDGIEYIKLENGTCYHKDVPTNLIAILEHARVNKIRIVVDYGDVKTKVSWNEVYDIQGYIGRLTGEIKIPLLVYNNRSLGGGALLDTCILSVKTTRGKKLLYEVN